MRSRIFAAIALAALALTPPALAQAEKRIALVIGNAAYKDAPLKNPVNDARRMAARLGQLGFDVAAHENATRQDMARAVAQFARKLGPDSAALIYYAGHGVQAHGRNYLIPVDARIQSETDLRFQAVDLGALTAELEQAQSRVSFVILDACRNNPFARRLRGAARGGLAPVDAARGTLIAYATAPDSVAADGDGDNGVYTSALLKALDAPGLKAEDVFKRVRIEVAQTTRNQQTPWESSSLTGDFVFNQAAAASPPVAGAAPVDREALFWQSAQASGRAEEYEAYLAQYPEGTFAPLARARIAALRPGSRPPATPARAATTIALSPQAWQRAPQFVGAMSAGGDGLILSGGAWTNGRLSNGAYDGNKVTSRDAVDLTGGGDVYMSFRPDGAGQYMAIFPRLFAGVSVKHMSTHHSWAGSVVVADRIWLYGHLRVEPDGSYRLVIARNAYDDRGGEAILASTGRLTVMRGQLEMQFGDNYAGTKASVVIGEARVR